MAAYSYHCHCTQLVLVSPTPLADLKQRASPGLDKAYILPLPPDPDVVDSMLVTTALAKPIIVKREDGFEKRWQQKCARCQLTFAYNLGASQFDAAASSAERRFDVLYILPGALKSTEELENADTT